MSTDNPKVSGYIPQHIYDRFKTFCEERGISMSQAVAVIFAEYFGLDLLVKQNSSTSGLLVERVGLLEQELADLRALVENHLELHGVIDKKEHLVVEDGSSPEAVSSDVADPTSITPSEPLIAGGLLGAELPEVLENVEDWSAEGDLPEITPSEAVGSLLGELLKNGDLPETESPGVESPEVLENAETLLVGGDLPKIIPSELVSDLPSEPLENHELSESVKPDTATVQESLDYPDGLLSPISGNSPEGIQPISGKKLSKQRFRLSQDSVSGARRRYKNPQSFIDWTRQRDPDGIAWKMVESPVPGYVPADELSSGLRDKLLTWIRENGLL
jgi:hypothetical protein